MAICGIQNIDGYTQADYRALGVQWSIAGALLALASVGALYKRTRPALVFSAVAIPASALCFYRSHAYFQVEEPEEEEEPEVELVELPTVFYGVPSLADLSMERLIDTVDPDEIPADLHQQLMDFAIRRGIGSFRRLLPLLEVTKLDLRPLGEYICDDDLRAIGRHQSQLQELQVSSSRLSVEPLLPLLNRNITHLKIGFLHADRGELVAAVQARCPDLVHLGISCDVEVLHSFPHLESFEGVLDATQYTGEPIPCLAQLKKLKAFGSVDDRILGQCTSLESLRSSGGHELRVPAGCAGTLKELSAPGEVVWPEDTVFEKLTTLKRDNAAPLDWAGAAFRRRFPVLERLKFGIIHRGGARLEQLIPHLGQLAPQLHSLEYGGTEHDEFAAAWPLVELHLPNLTELSVWQTRLDVQMAREILASPLRVTFRWQTWVEGLTLEEMLALSGNTLTFAEDQVDEFYRAALNTPRVSWTNRSSVAFTAQLAALLQPTDALKIRRTLILPFDRSTAYDAVKVLRHCPHVRQPRLWGRGETGPTPTQWRRIGQVLRGVADTRLSCAEGWEFSREHFAGLVEGLGGGVTVRLHLPDNRLSVTDAIEVLEASPRDFHLLLADPLHTALNARFPRTIG